MSKITRGADLFTNLRAGKAQTPDEELVTTTLGRGHLLARAQRGDREARRLVADHKLAKRTEAAAAAALDDTTDSDADPAPDYGAGTRDQPATRPRGTRSGPTSGGADLFRNRSTSPYDA